MELENKKIVILKNSNVLFIENNKILQEKMTVFLKGKVNSLTIADDAKTGYELFLKYRPDVVISEVLLPDKDGLSICGKIRKINSRVIIIFITAFDDKDYLLKAIDIGVSAYLIKPLNYEKLLDCLIDNSWNSIRRYSDTASGMKIQKLESIGELAKGISNEFNNILTSILGTIAVTKLRFDKEDRLYKLLDKAEVSSAKAKDLIIRFLSFTKGKLSVKKRISLKNIVIDAANLSTSGSSVGCSFLIADGLWDVVVDKEQIGLVIQNIVLNSVNAMPNGGELEISLENRQIEKSELLPLVSGKYLLITIKDSGVGIMKDDLPRIFESYFSGSEKEKSGHSGLGLSISDMIIRNHSGFIRILSEQEEGTTALIYLPASEIPSDDEKGEESKQLEDQNQKIRILVMDDQEILCEVMKSYLEHLGYEVFLALNGSEALKQYNRALSQEMPIDVVILDLTIPGGMGGKETISRLLKINPEIKAMIMSGYLDHTTLEEYKKLGFKESVTKPFNFQELHEKLQKMLEEKK